MSQGMKWHRNMRDERMRMVTNHKKKNKNLRSRNISDGGGGNIAGLALAVVGFIAVVSLSILNKNRTKGSESNSKPKPQKCKSQEDDEIETNQGLHTLVQHSSSTTTTNDVDSASCHGTIDTKSINHTLIQEKKIDTVSDMNNISEVVSVTSIHQEEIVLSDDSHSESAASEAEKVDDDDDVVSEIVEEKECSSKAMLNCNDKQDFSSKDEGRKIDNDMQNEEHVEAKTDTEVDNDGVNVEPEEITSGEEGKLSTKVNDQDQPMSVSDSFQLTTLIMLLPGLILLLVLLLLMYLTQKISFLQ